MKLKKFIKKFTIIFSILGIVLFVVLRFNSVLAATKIDDASNFGVVDLSPDSHLVVRTSTGTLYALVLSEEGPTDYCGIWKSTDGTSWAEQDNADRPVCIISGNSRTGIAIDSTNKIHIFFKTSIISGGSAYKTFTTSDDLWGSGVPISDGTTSIAIDSNDIPHVISQDNNPDDPLLYRNRIGGTWNSTVQVGTVIDSVEGSIAINEDNIPEITWMIGTTLGAAVGNQNNATSFTTQTAVDGAVNGTDGTRSASIAIDSAGNTWIAYVDENGASDYVTLIEHLDSQASWATWETPVTDSVVGSEPSIAINGTDIYVFYQDANNDVAYDKYAGSWLGSTVLQTGTFRDVRAKWSYLYNNQGSTQIDYLYSDSTDIFWDKLTLGPAVPTKVAFSNSARTLAQTICNGAAKVFTMELQDAGGTPTNPSGTTVIRVTSDSGSYVIYSDDTCTTVATSGDFTYTTAQNTKSVYIIDNQVSALRTLTATKQSGPESITTGTQNYQVIATSGRLKGGFRLKGGTRLR